MDTPHDPLLYQMGLRKAIPCLSSFTGWGCGRQSTASPPLLNEVAEGNPLPLLLYWMRSQKVIPNLCWGRPFSNKGKNLLTHGTFRKVFVLSTYPILIGTIKDGNN
jgi:hypothetical protein